MKKEIKEQDVTSMSDHCHAVCEVEGCGNTCSINEHYHAGPHRCSTHL